MSNVLSRANQLLTPKKNTNFWYGFLPEIIKEYFDDGPGVDNDLKIKPSSTQFVLTGSMITSTFDPYRQGIELTRTKHFDMTAGPKIHAGEPGHVLRKNSYGADRNFFDPVRYEDNTLFDPVNYIKNQETYSFPIVTSDSFELENYNFNGVIEPLTIRAALSFSSIEFPFESHDTRGNLEDGNGNVYKANSRISNVYERNPRYRIVPWLDMIDMIGEGQNKIPTIGYLNDDKSYVTPFNDLSLKIQLSQNLEGIMLSAVQALEGSTETYINDEFVTAPCGWTYDDVTLRGTDSIAFGGLGY